MKKIVALVLTLAMVMSFSMIAFAGEPEPGGGTLTPEIVGDTSNTVSFDLVYTPGEDLYPDYVEVEVSWTSTTAGSYSFTKEAKSFVWNTETYEYDEDGTVIPASGELIGTPQLEVNVVNLSSPDHDFNVSFSVLTDGISDMWDDESGIWSPYLQAGKFSGRLTSETGAQSLANRTGNWAFNFGGLDNDKVIAKVNEMLELDPSLEEVSFEFSTNVVIEAVQS